MTSRRKGLLEVEIRREQRVSVALFCLVLADRVGLALTLQGNAVLSVTAALLSLGLLWDKQGARVSVLAKKPNS